MACKRSAVRSRLPPPQQSFTGSPSSRGLGHRPFTAITGVRIPVGTPRFQSCGNIAGPSPVLVWVNGCAEWQISCLESRPVPPWVAGSSPVHSATNKNDQGASRLLFYSAVKVVTGSPSSRGLGHRPFTAITGVRIPVGTPACQAGSV